jgi:pimeloyl-ACP methyl ester carboxylesterase
MESHTIAFSNGRIHYSVYGTGLTNVIAFHGFGQDGSVFQILANRFSEYQFIAPDLPFHGKSVLTHRRQPITADQVIEIVKLITEERQIDRFSIMAFSIGARFVWPLFSSFIDRLDSVTLLAPDGLPTSVWYRVATFSKISRWLFRKVMDNESIIAGVIKMTKSLGITDRQTSTYLQKSIGTADMRDRIYNTWISLRFLEPDLSTIANTIRNQGTNVQIVLGENDNLIDSEGVIRILQGIQGVNILLLPCQHHQLLEKYVNWKIEENKGEITGC